MRSRCGKRLFADVADLEQKVNKKLKGAAVGANNVMRRHRWDSPDFDCWGSGPGHHTGAIGL